MTSDTHPQPQSSVQGWPADRWPGATAEEESERILVIALQAGDESAFARLVNRHNASMVRVAGPYVADRSVAEEVVQETWLAVIRGLAEFQGRSSLKTWIYRILVNRACTRGARDKRIIPFSSLGGEADGPAVEPSHFRDGAWATPVRPWLDPERRLESLEARDELRRALAELPDRQRAVVTLRDVEGFGAAEVAELLGVTDGNQRVLLNRGRARLRAALAPVLDDGALAA